MNQVAARCTVCNRFVNAATEWRFDAWMCKLCLAGLEAKRMGLEELQKQALEDPEAMPVLLDALLEKGVLKLPRTLSRERGKNYKGPNPRKAEKQRRFLVSLAARWARGELESTQRHGNDDD